MKTLRNNFKTILTEAPHIANIRCPHCKKHFTLDARMELWDATPHEKAEYITDYFKYQKIDVTCPNCISDLIYDGKSRTAYDYDEIINRLPKYERDYIEKIKRLCDKFSATVEIEENLKFKTFCAVINS